MQKVLCIADSLGLPRESVPYDDTWISTVKKSRQNLDFITIFKRALTSDSLKDGNEFLIYYYPNIVILQIGIVDCAPRYIKTNSILNKLVLRLPAKAQTLFWMIYKKIFKRSIKKVDVPIGRFETNLRYYCELCQKNNIQKILMLKICTPSPFMTRKNPLIKEAVLNYNSVLEKIGMEFSIVKLLDPLNIGSDEFYVDGYHPNKFGHQLVASEILKEL